MTRATRPRHRAAVTADGGCPPCKPFRSGLEALLEQPGTPAELAPAAVGTR